MIYRCALGWMAWPEGRPTAA